MKTLCPMRCSVRRALSFHGVFRVFSLAWPLLGLTPVLICCSWTSRQSSSSWEPLPGLPEGGNISGSSGSSFEPTIAVDPCGSIFVMWIEEGNPVPASAVYENASGQWLTGEILLDAGQLGHIREGVPSSPRLVADPSGNVCALWLQRYSGYSEIYVAVWSGSSWRVLNDNGSGSHGIVCYCEYSLCSIFCDSSPCLALDDQGLPVIAWSSYMDGSYRLLVSRWTGDHWQSLLSQDGMSSDPEAPSNNLNATMATGYDGFLYLAWEEYDARGWENGEALVRCLRYDGTEWQVLDGIEDSNLGALDTMDYGSLEIVPNVDGGVCMAWVGATDGGTLCDVGLVMWKEGEWVEIVGPIDASDLAGVRGCVSGLDLTADSSGDLVLAMESCGERFCRVDVFGWAGARWMVSGYDAAESGIAGDNAQHNTQPTIACDSEGTIYALFVGQQDGNTEIMGYQLRLTDRYGVHLPVTGLPEASPDGGL